MADAVRGTRGVQSGMAWGQVGEKAGAAALKEDVRGGLLSPLSRAALAGTTGERGAGGACWPGEAERRRGRSVQDQTREEGGCGELAFRFLHPSRDRARPPFECSAADRVFENI